MRAEFRRDEAQFFIDLMKDFLKGNKEVKGYVHFTKDAFKNEVPEESRIYLIDNENSKGVKHGMLGKSIFAKPLNSDKGTRIEEEIYNKSKYIEKLVLEVEVIIPSV